MSTPSRGRRRRRRHDAGASAHCWAAHVAPQARRRRWRRCQRRWRRPMRWQRRSPPDARRSPAWCRGGEGAAAAASCRCWLAVARHDRGSSVQAQQRRWATSGTGGHSSAAALALKRPADAHEAHRCGACALTHGWHWAPHRQRVAALVRSSPRIHRLLLCLSLHLHCRRSDARSRLLRSPRRTLVGSTLRRAVKWWCGSVQRDDATSGQARRLRQLAPRRAEPVAHVVRC